MDSQLTCQLDTRSVRPKHGPDELEVMDVLRDQGKELCLRVGRYRTHESSWKVELVFGESEMLARCDCHAEGGPLDCEHVRCGLGFIEHCDLPLADDGKLNLKAYDENYRWRVALAAVDSHYRHFVPDEPAGGSQRRLQYVLDLEESSERDAPAVLIYDSRPKKRGGWTKPRLIHSIHDRKLKDLDARNREAVELLKAFHNRSYYYSYEAVTEIPTPAIQTVFSALAATEELYFRLNEEHDQWLPLKWSGRPWAVRLRMDRGPDAWQITGEFDDGERRRGLTDAAFLVGDRAVLFQDEMGPLAGGPAAHAWVVNLLAERGAITVPEGDAEALLEELTNIPGQLEMIELPEEFRYVRVAGTPLPRMRVERPPRGSRMLEVDIEYLYGDPPRPARSGAGAVDHQRRQILLRDAALERQQFQVALKAGVKEGPRLQLPPELLPGVVATLVSRGWQVEADGKLLRKAGRTQVSVTSGVDWFDLEGKFDFDGQEVSIPKVLSALRRGDKYVALDDGTQGLLPEEWLEKFGALAHLGEADGDVLRFTMPQAALLDALLEAQDHVELDAKYRQYRERLHSFEGVEPADPSPKFQGELREYQREGLGWLQFLREFQLGGCLADDMGLGKTIQVLALLQQERAKRRKKSERLPSLIVVPRSLLFNWRQEAERFTPELKVMQYFGTQRADLLDDWDQQDLILTTYGIVRRDIEMLRDKSFHYVVLDEAQAIKNDKSLSAKSCRLLNARHRLALTGTPVENHLGELWSLFEFLNPGLLGRNEAFLGLARRAKDDPQARELISRGIRPFVLRRAKQDVLDDLPDKTEQTLFCEMEKSQRAAYDELRDYYRGLLAKKVADQGLKRSKIHVLEALLRLRQCACHPALIDPDTEVPSAKLKSLLATLEELIDEGHKALVFSQFTKLLAIVRGHLDERGVAYEYLDGRTRKRQERVEAFQNNPDCPLFLISLKAGGHGLNLTAADYVFILDPWWNPAVEAQAVDRAHRIGQDKPVFAYRLICRDTVEEKILQLQSEKRDLAAAIINADNNLLRDLTPDDLAVLLS